MSLRDHGPCPTGLEAHTRFGARLAAFGSVAVLGLLLGCSGATRNASPQRPGEATVTAASIAPRIERLVVADEDDIAMVARGGCVATVHASDSQLVEDELRVRCPKPERMHAWFDGADRVMAGFQYELVKDEEEEEVTLPAAKVLTTSGKTLKVKRPEDVQRLLAEVRALSEELARSEQPTPGPASEDGWQMLHVAGPAHVLFAGTPAHGDFEARMSTNGQYYCEFVTDVGDGPMRASKSGWISPSVASRAIDQVLGPFTEVAPHEAPTSTYAAGTKNGAEKKSAASSTAAVFERFAEIQEALGDACLPELEPPPPTELGL